MSLTTSNERPHIGFLPGLILVGLLSIALRLWGAWHVSLRFEETLALAVAGNLSLVLRQIHPPFYFLFLAAWTRIFGDSILSLQILFAMAGTVGVVFTALIGKKILGEKAGLLSAVVLCLAPYPLMLNRLDGMHTFVAMFASASILLLLGLLEEERKPLASWALAVVNILGLFTNYLFVFIFLTQPLFLIFLKGTGALRRRDILLAWLIPLAALLLASPLFYAQYVLMIRQNDSFPAISTLWTAPFGQWISDAAFGIPWSQAPTDTGASDGRNIVGIGLSIAGVLLLLFGIFGAVIRKTSQRMAVLSLSFIPVLFMLIVSSAVPVWSSASFCILFPFLALIWGMALDMAGKAGAVVAVALAALLAWGIFININVTSKVNGAWMKPPAWKDLASDLVTQFSPGDNLLITPDWMSESLFYHVTQVSGRGKNRNAVRWPVIGVPFDFFHPDADVSEELTLQPNTRAWLLAVDGFSAENAMRFLERAGYRLSQHAVYWRLNLDLFQKIPEEEPATPESGTAGTDETSTLK